MNVSSRTPEGEPNRCPICGKASEIEPSSVTADAPCPHCGCLMWYDPYLPAQYSRRELCEYWMERFRRLAAAEEHLPYYLPQSLLNFGREMTDAVAAAVWLVRHNAVSNLAHEDVPPACFAGRRREEHKDLLRTAARQPHSLFVWSAAVEGRPTGNPTDFVLALQRFELPAGVFVLELFLPPELTRAKRKYLRRLLSAAEEIVTTPAPISPIVQLRRPESAATPWWKRIFSRRER